MSRPNPITKHLRHTPGGLERIGPLDYAVQRKLRRLADQHFIPIRAFRRILEKWDIFSRSDRELSGRDHLNNDCGPGRAGNLRVRMPAVESVR
jgi:hypothetical protein